MDLEVAAEKANEAGKPLVAAFFLTQGRAFHKEANLRHYAFLLEGTRRTHGRRGQLGGLD